MKTLINNKEMMIIVTSVSSGVTKTKMKTMISNNEMTIVTTVSRSETMMALKTIISNRKMMTIMTIAGTPETTVTILRMTS